MTLEGEDTSTTDETTDSGATSGAESDASSGQSSDDSGQDGQTTQPPTDDNVPFNDPKSPYHARFKELHEQASSNKAELERERQERAQMRSEYEQRLAQIQAQIKPPVVNKPYQPLFERLDKLGADPEFTKLLKEQVEIMEQFPNLRQDLQSIQAERNRSAVQSEVNRLYDEFKVPAPMRKHYENALIAAGNRNPKLTNKDIPATFKQIHEEFATERKAMEREILKGYVKAKAGDTTPASTTGGKPAATKANAAKVLKPEEYRAYVKKQFVEELRKQRASE